MQVMETNRPLFSGTGSAAVNNAERQQAERANHGNDDIENTILYIERFYQLGQPVEHLPGYDVWKKWKDKQQKWTFFNRRKAVFLFINQVIIWKLNICY